MAANDETKTLARGAIGQRASAAQIRVVSGVDLGATTSLSAATPRVFIGTGPVCDLRLTDPAVSRRHLTVEMEGQGIRITDLESTNGTFFGGAKLLAAELPTGSIVRIGSTDLLFETHHDVSAPAKSPGPMFGRTVAESLEMRRLNPLLERIARSNVPVLIEGETGTGKEALAESIHDAGDRKKGPFVVFDCTAVPPNLIESELFGHEKGAFTGAVQSRPGVFEQADGGTLLIDEIGDLELNLQPKLLRVLERSEIRRVGASQIRRVDVRVIAATRRQLDNEVGLGRFRDDLFHRLVVARVELPPLRKRRGDVRVLVDHFCRMNQSSIQVIPAAVLERWENDPWPGNVRELRNAVLRQIALGDLAPPSSSSRALSKGEGDDFIDEVLALGLPIERARQKVVAQFERRYLEDVLERHHGNVGEAAKASGVARRHFQRLRSRAAEEER